MPQDDAPRPPGGRRGGAGDDGPHLETRRMMARASRRLGILEMVFLVAAVVLALLGGALAAYGLQEGLGVPFRPTWAVVSLLLFVVPAALVWRRERRFERERKEAREREPREPDEGEEWKAGSDDEREGR